MPTPWWDGDPRSVLQKDGSTGVPEAIPRTLWSEWDKMSLAGFDVPGHVVVFGRKLKKTDMRDPLATSGMILTHLGYDPTELDITITMWTPEQFAAYEELLAAVVPKAFPQPPATALAPAQGIFVYRNGQLTQIITQPAVTSVQLIPAPGPTPASPLSIIHPNLNAMGVYQVYIHDIGLLVPGPVPQTKVAIWRATEIAPITAILPTNADKPYEPLLHGPVGRSAPSLPVAPPSAGIPP